MTSFSGKEGSSPESSHFAVSLMDTFWKLHSCQPANPVLASLASIGKEPVLLACLFVCFRGEMCTMTRDFMLDSRVIAVVAS